MKMKEYLLLGLGSCAFWAVLFGIGFFNTDPDPEGWYGFWTTMLVLTDFIAAECFILLVICLIREKCGYGVDMVG